MPPQARPTPLTAAETVAPPFAAAAILGVLLAVSALVAAPFIAALLIAYAAMPYYREFLPGLPAARRAAAYVAAGVAVFGPVAGAVLALNPGAPWHPALAARLAIAVAGAGFALGAAGIVSAAFYRLEQYRTVQALPTSRAASAAQGLVELKGRARAAVTGEPILNVPFRLGAPVALPGFWLEDDSGRVWVDPGGVPVRYRAPRAFGFRVNDVILTRNALANRLGATRLALFDGDRVYVIGQLRQERDPADPGAFRAVVGPAVQEAEARDYRHMFFLSDSSEAAALRHLARGVRNSWLLGWVWVAAALAVLFLAAPRALPDYDRWRFGEVVRYAPAERLVDILTARWHTKPAERRAVALAIAERVQPPGGEAVLAILADALGREPVSERAPLYAGLGKLTGHKYAVVPLLVAGLEPPASRNAAAAALYALSESEGFGTPANDAVAAFGEHGGERCPALAQLSETWWAWNIGGPLGVELLKCAGAPRARGDELIAEHADTLDPRTAPGILAALDVPARRAILRALAFRDEPRKELAAALAGQAYDADPATAAFAAALAERVGMPLAATAESALTAALQSSERDVRRAALQGMRLLPSLGDTARGELVALGVNGDAGSARDALLVLAGHEPEPGRTRLLKLLAIGHAYEVRARYLVELNTGVAPEKVSYGYGVTTADITRPDQIWQLAQLGSSPRAMAYAHRKVLAALASGDMPVRRAAAGYFGQRREFTPAAVAALVAALSDPAPEVRLAAADSLLKLRRPPDSLRPALEAAAARDDVTGEMLRMVLRRYAEPAADGAPLIESNPE